MRASIRWIALSLFTLVVAPVVVDILKAWANKIGLYDRPQDAANEFLGFLTVLAHEPIAQVSALCIGGFTAGVWLDWILRQFDGSRAERRKNIGVEARDLADTLKDAIFHSRIDLAWPRNIQRHRSDVASTLLKLKSIGIWIPDGRLFNITTGESILPSYLDMVGTLLSEGHFRDAKKAALEAKREFDAKLA